MENAICLYDQKWCKIYYHADVPCIRLEWTGFALSHQFREACDKALALLVEKKCSMMIADNTNAKVVANDDQKWMNEVWFPSAYAQGYRGSAVIVAQDIFRDLAVKNIVNEMDKGKFIVQFFSDLPSAIDWLKTLKYVENL
jgi:hypothetical protein